MSLQSLAGLRIIKAGTPPNSRLIRSTCRACGCEFEAPRGMWKLNPDQRDGNFYSMDCPTQGCTHVITVSQAKVEGGAR